jgi:hypothetical protein
VKICDSFGREGGDAHCCSSPGPTRTATCRRLSRFGRLVVTRSLGGRGSAEFSAGCLKIEARFVTSSLSRSLWRREQTLRKSNVVRCGWFGGRLRDAGRLLLCPSGVGSRVSTSGETPNAAASARATGGWWRNAGARPG